MPLVTVTLLQPQPRAFKDAVLNAVHSALVHIGVPPTDVFQRVLQLTAEDFRFDRNYPDVQGARSDDFVLVEILLSAGRSVKVKKQCLAHWVQQFQAAGHHPEDLMGWSSRKPAGKTGRLQAGGSCMFDDCTAA